MTHPMLANVTPDANTIWVVVIALASVGANIATIITVLRGGKQKREISFGFEPASKTDFEKHIETNRREHENLFSKIGGVERGALGRCEIHTREFRQIVDDRIGEIVSSGERGREKIHDRINEVLAAVSELRGKVEEMTR